MSAGDNESILGYDLPLLEIYLITILSVKKFFECGKNMLTLNRLPIKMILTP